MKQIKAIIRPEMLDIVRTALEKNGCPGIMVSDIVGQGTQKGITQSWRGEKYSMDLIPKVVLDIVVKDEEVDKIVEAILSSAPVGEFGDGKLFIYNVEQAIRLRTGEKGEAVL